MTDYATAYASTRRRISDLAMAATPEDLERRVPACPDWSAFDLICHVAGVAHDTATGALEGAGGDDWTRSHIDARKDRSIEDVLEEFERFGSQLDAVVANLPPSAAGLLIGDTVTHEHDLRAALGAPGARDSEAVVGSLEVYTRFFGRRVRDAGVPSVLVESDGFSLVAGKEEPQLSLRAEAFELLRALTGRRTPDEIRALEWSGDPSPYMELLPQYGVPERSLGE